VVLVIKRRRVYTAYSRRLGTIVQTVLRLLQKLTLVLAPGVYARVRWAVHAMVAANKLSQSVRYHDGLPGVAPLNAVIDPALSSSPTLNVLLPGMSMKAMSGGPNTVINLVYRLAAQGVRLRFISTDVPADADHASLFQHFADLTQLPVNLPNVSIACGFDRSKPLMLGANDRFIASAWWNVQMIKRLLPLTQNGEFFYVIQDFEPGLYAWSTRYALALETYSLNYRPILCSNLLAEYMVANHVGRFAEDAFVKKALVFEPAVDGTKFYPEESRGDQRIRRLLFYARPTMAERNLFELGLYALRTATELGYFDGDDWEMLFIGEQVPDVTLGRDCRIQAAGWLDYEQYAALMRSSDIVLSLMLSPHTSYPPIEAAASGAIAVTNVFANKTGEALARLSPNLVGVAPSLEGVVEGLRAATERVRISAVSRQPVNVPVDWAQSFVPCLAPLLQALSDCRN
jgi:hypothetical protein